MKLKGLLTTAAVLATLLAMPGGVSALRSLLNALEVDVETCSDPIQAVTMFSAGEYDLVISDERMPKMSGLEMLGKVRAGSPRTPTILLTAYRNQDAFRRAYERTGVFRFVTKPWNAIDLIATIREALRARETLD